MGREIVASATYDGRSGEVKALLESQGIILRAPMSLTIPRDGISGLSVEGEALVGQGPRGMFELGLGAVGAGKWKAALEKPLPTLADKLGLKAAMAVCVIGDADSPELTAALAGVVAAPPEQAGLVIVCATDAEGLVQALERIAGSAAPVWVVHGKGKDATFGEAPVRALMRERGFIDTKVSAVSARLSAIRFSRR